MPWTPKYPQMDFGEVILDNLARIFERDQAEALTWAQTGSGLTLTPFARVLHAPRFASRFPSLAVFPREDNPRLLEEEGVSQKLEFIYELAITSSKPGQMVRELMRRTKAVRMMIISAALTDLMKDVSVKSAQVTLELGNGVYEAVREPVAKDGLYYQALYFTSTFAFEQN